MVRSIIKASFRFFILLSFINGLTLFLYNAGGYLPYDARSRGFSPTYLLVFLVGPAVLMTVVLSLLWKKTDRIVGFLAGDLDDNQLVISTSNVELLRTLMVFLGMYLLARAVPYLIGLTAGRIYLANVATIAGPPLSPIGEEIRLWVTNLATLLLGVSLIAGNRVPKMLSNLWKSGSPSDKTTEET